MRDPTLRVRGDCRVAHPWTCACWTWTSSGDRVRQHLPFGKEGAFAFNGAYCRLTGGTFTPQGQCNGGENIPGFNLDDVCREGTRYCGIDAGAPSFDSQIGTVNGACNQAPKCNFVLLLLEPASALKWMGGQFPSARDFERNGGCCGMAGAQPLFTESFARECKNACDRMMVWTGYNPPVGAYLSEPAVAQYRDELRSRNNRADPFNQFTLGGYIGMTLLVDALERVGPDLTRDKLVQTLNSMQPLKTGLTNPDGLQWTAQQRYANHSAQSFRISYSDRFNEFSPHESYTRDPWLGQDNKLP